MLETVSIPYRQARNMFFLYLSCIPFCVSIPYRQARNTIYWRMGIPRKNSFNSLQVGSQHFQKRAIYGRVLVSIPYRQARNINTSFKFCLCFAVSIPYRQARNEIMGYAPHRDNFCFNSLQVGSQLCHNAPPFVFFIISFNSLQVGSQLCPIPIQSQQISQFQFLIGRLAT